MDGAARFNQRDAMATILITAINIIAGFLIGVFQLGIPLAEALKTYTVLTVGDGLVTMIPSLLVSVAGGIVLTRASSRSSLGTDLQQQLFANARVAVDCRRRHPVASADSRPAKVFLSQHCRRRRAAGPTAVDARERAEGCRRRSGCAAGLGSGRGAEALESLLALDELSLEVGYGLVPLVDASREANCCNGYARCASTWRCNWDSSCLRFTLPTTCD